MCLNTLAHTDMDVLKNWRLSELDTRGCYESRISYVSYIEILKVSAAFLFQFEYLIKY